MYDIITQLVGIGATVLTILSFQAKTQKGLMMIQSVSTILWTVHFFMLGLIKEDIPLPCSASQMDDGMSL